MNSVQLSNPIELQLHSTHCHRSTPLSVDAAGCGVKCESMLASERTPKGIAADKRLGDTHKRKYTCTDRHTHIQTHTHWRVMSMAIIGKIITKLTVKVSECVKRGGFTHTHTHTT
jgi:hypothetical protein